MFFKNKINTVVNHYGTLKLLFSKTHKELVVCSPYINCTGVQFLIRHVTNHKTNFTLITDLNSESILSEYLQTESLLQLFKHFCNLNLYHLSKLHAKIYLNDAPSALITSANLTGGGILGNYEFGIYMEEPFFINNINKDLKQIIKVSKSISEDKIQRIHQKKNKINKSFQKITISESKVIDFINLIHECTEINDNEDVSASENIKFILLELLEKNGHMITKDIHRHIEQNYPELCGPDDRIINGKKFGKLWKHRVRNAQQSLKKSKLIDFDGKFWKII